MKGLNRGSVLLLGLALAGVSASAQPHHDAGHDMMVGMEKMNHDMGSAPMTGDADHDFVAMMMPHHQGAIDMAQIELRDGKDPALRRLAAAIVAAQQKEIAMMKHWQQARSGR